MAMTTGKAQGIVTIVTIVGFAIYALANSGNPQAITKSLFGWGFFAAMSSIAALWVPQLIAPLAILVLMSLLLNSNVQNFFNNLIKKVGL